MKIPSVFLFLFKSAVLNSLRLPKFILKTSVARKSRLQNSINSNTNYNNATESPQSMLAPLSFVPPSTSADDEWTTSNERAFIPTRPTSLSQYEEKKPKSLAADSFKPASDTSRRYFELVEKLSPNELLQKFAESAPRNVQEATKSTIVNILGTLPNYALDAALITTSSKLANLLYQMQLTGYMFKNAEYRMSLTRSLKGYPRLPAPAVVNVGNSSIMLQGTRVLGNVKVADAEGRLVDVDADDLIRSLSREVQDLRSELAAIRDSREAELRSNLLTYIQALPERELSRLTADMSEDVMESIKMVVNALMERLGVDITGPDVIIQQSVGAMAQLCMWQMVVGYKLREFEAFEKGLSFTADGPSLQ